MHLSIFHFLSQALYFLQAKATFFSAFLAKGMRLIQSYVHSRSCETAAVSAVYVPFGGCDVFHLFPVFLDSWFFCFTLNAFCSHWDLRWQTRHATFQIKTKYCKMVKIKNVLHRYLIHILYKDTIKSMILFNIQTIVACNPVSYSTLKWIRQFKVPGLSF